VNFTLQENGTTSIDGGVSGVKDNFINMIKLNQIDLGAPILNADVGSTKVNVVADGGDNTDGQNQNEDGTPAGSANPGQIIV